MDDSEPADSAAEFVVGEEPVLDEPGLDELDPEPEPESEPDPDSDALLAVEPEPEPEPDSDALLAGEPIEPEPESEPVEPELVPVEPEPEDLEPEDPPATLVFDAWPLAHLVRVGRFEPLADAASG